MTELISQNDPELQNINNGTSIKQPFTTVVFDWKRTLYSPENRELIHGATELVSKLHRHKKRLVLIGMGEGETNMQDEVERLGVKDYFSSMLFVADRKRPEDFRPHISEVSPEQTLVVGDRVKSELRIGKALQATTIWVRQGQFSEEMPEEPIEEPTYTVSQLTDVYPLIRANFRLR